MLEEHEHKHAVHEFDGIIENRVASPPVYFTVLFYGLVIWGVAFCAFYLLSGWSSEKEFNAEMSEYQQQQKMADAGQKPPEQKPAAAAPVSTGDEQDGEALYQQHCAMCHGEQMEGGIGPNLADSEAIYGLSRDAVQESIANGRPNGMPAFAGQLNSDEISLLTDYILSAAPAGEPKEEQQTSTTEPPAEPAEADKSMAESTETASQKIDAAALFAKQCAMCHGADGKGGIGPDMTDSKYIYGKSQADVVESITNGRPNGMPAFGNKLEEAEISALAEYVRAL